MPKTSKVKKKVSKVKTKTIKKPKVKTITKPKAKSIAKPKVINKGPIKISKTYEPKDTEKYMCEKHKVFFRMKL
jgi:DnaK suppressor protein